MNDHVKHQTIPSPNSCKWCGREKRDHGWYGHKEVGNHQWVEPSDAQRKARMLERRSQQI